MKYVPNDFLRGLGKKKRIRKENPVLVKAVLRGSWMNAPTTFPGKSSMNDNGTQYLTPRTYPLGHHP